MYVKIKKLEQVWLDRLLSVDFKGKGIVKRQILTSKIILEKYPSLISLKFLVDKNLEKFPFKVRVPVEMRAFQEQSAPIIFLLHIIDGFINELEIFSADASEINSNDISFKKVEFEIDKKVLLD
jgi:hypothetical protein